MTKHSVMIDLNDPRTGKIAEVLANKTCKKILAVLSEKELSESELSDKLGLPANTINYNIKNLIEAGLIVSSKQFWSVKGRRMVIYRVSDKSIVISPKNMAKGIIPAIVVSVLGALGIKMFLKSSQELSSQDIVSQDVIYGMESVASKVSSESLSYGSEAFNSGIYYTINNAPNSWAWFFLGGLVVTLVILFYNWRNS